MFFDKLSGVSTDHLNVHDDIKSSTSVTVEDFLVNSISIQHIVYINLLNNMINKQRRINKNLTRINMKVKRHFKQPLENKFMLGKMNK